MVQSVEITRALEIPGWMTEPELVWLAQQAQQHKVIVEIGSYLGRSTRALLDNTDGVVFAVDDWYGPRDVDLSPEERQGLYDKFINNVSPQREHYKKLMVCHMDHKQAGGLRVMPDMVFIDGSHEYQDVKRDIQTWKDWMMPGGLLCGHDAGWDGVRQAVSELLGNVDVVDNTTIWWTRI